jgi:hypothetical protein
MENDGLDQYRKTVSRRMFISRLLVVGAATLAGGAVVDYAINPTEISKPQANFRLGLISVAGTCISAAIGLRMSTHLR